jgi:hypothetical protein
VKSKKGDITEVTEMNRMVVTRGTWGRESGVMLVKINKFSV